jgi:hypothetical protein
MASPQAMGKKAPISLRVNPDVDAKTHPYISTGLKENKFGVAYEDARALYRQAANLANLEISGIDCHIGSQLLTRRLLPKRSTRCWCLSINWRLTASCCITSTSVAASASAIVTKRRRPSRPICSPCCEAQAAQLRILLEPGRRLVGNAGLLLTRVEYLKPGEIKNFAIVDAAMNDLARPALYGSWHDIVPVVPRAGLPMPWDIVGPVCESGDFLGHGRELALAAGDLLAIMSAGCLRHGHEFELQQPTACRRSDGRRRADPSRPPPRDGRGSVCPGVPPALSRAAGNHVRRKHTVDTPEASGLLPRQRGQTHPDRDSRKDLAVDADCGVVRSGNPLKLESVPA